MNYKGIQLRICILIEMLIILLSKLSNRIKQKLMKLYLHEIIAHIPIFCMNYDFDTGSTERGEKNIGIIKNIIKNNTNKKSSQITEMIFSKLNYIESSQNYYLKQENSEANRKINNIWKNYKWEEIIWDLEFIKKSKKDILFWLNWMQSINEFNDYIFVKTENNEIIEIKFKTIEDIKCYIEQNKNNK